jgi:hypothetical protein
MSRARPRETAGLYGIARPVRPPAQYGEKTVGPAQKRLKALLEEPVGASEAEVEAELDSLAAARAKSRAFILAVTEGEP